MTSTFTVRTIYLSLRLFIMRRMLSLNVHCQTEELPIRHILHDSDSIDLFYPMLIGPVKKAAVSR